MSDQKNKVKYGLSNAHYAPLTETTGEDGNTTYSYGTPVPMPGSVELSLEAQGEATKKRADNADYFVSVSNNGYEGDLTMTLIPKSFRTDILGEVESTDGLVSEYGNITPKPFALLFQFEGDATATRYVLYNCKCTRPNIASATTEETIETQDDSLTITASPRISDSLVKAFCEPSASVYETWFSKVHEPAAAASA